MTGSKDSTDLWAPSVTSRPEQPPLEAALLAAVWGTWGKFATVQLLTSLILILLSTAKWGKIQGNHGGRDTW